jgi:hypothetical protein
VLKAVEGTCGGGHAAHGFFKWIGSFVSHTILNTMSIKANPPRPVPTPDLLWKHIRDTWELLLKFNVFYYAATGAIVSYYFSKPDIPWMKFSLWFPILMSIGFAILFIYGASQTHVVRQELFDIRDKLGLDTAPEYKVLYIFLWVSSVLMLITASGLLVMMFDLKVPPPKVH